MTRAVEVYYTVCETGLLLGLCTKTVLIKLKAQCFGVGVVNLGSAARPDYRIPASGINVYLDRCRVFSESESKPVSARSVGELRRKAA